MTRVPGAPDATRLDAEPDFASSDVLVEEWDRSAPRPNALDARLAFLVGCARSGTTWLQLLLSQHPAVATSQETHLFSRYLARLEHGWQFEHDPRFGRKRNTGLAAVVGEDEFYALCRAFAVDVLARIRSNRPGASVVLEKTPAHVRQAALIRRLFPNAYFIHLVRDPRSVAASMLSAARSWGAHWAPATPASAARTWRDDVEAGRRIREETERYFEVRYEDLRRDGERVLEQLFDWLELPVEEGFARRAIEACDINRLRSGKAPVRSSWSLEREPAGFYRRGSAAGWRQELTARDVATIEYITRDLMQTFGYEPTAWRGERAPVALVIRDALRWRVAAALRQADQWVRRL